MKIVNNYIVLIGGIIMVRAIYNGVEIGKSENTIEVEGNKYFPKEDINETYLEKSDHHSSCPWKGKASYYNVVVDGKHNRNAAWYYPEPFEKATMIKDYIAFWKGIEVKVD